MAETTIYLDELECPHCDWDKCNESWDISIDEYNKDTTTVVCENCGNSFYVQTSLSVDIKKTDPSSAA